MDEPLGGARRDTWAALDRGRRGDLAVNPIGTEGAGATSATYKVGDWIEHLGRRLRDDGVTSRVGAADVVGRALERFGEYLEHREMAGIRSDAERLIVRRPVLSLALAAVVGYAAGRMIWR
jgi:hypothetical protein